MGGRDRPGVWARMVVNRWQLLILSLATGGGVTLLLGGPRPGTLNELLPSSIVTVWAVMLTAGSTLGVIALLTTQPAVLRIGMTLLSGAATAYWLAILATAGWLPALALGWPILAFAACALGDVLVITFAAYRAQP